MIRRRIRWPDDPLTVVTDKDPDRTPLSLSMPTVTFNAEAFGAVALKTSEALKEFGKAIGDLTRQL
jgi:hypothetical protein